MDVMTPAAAPVRPPATAPTDGRRRILESAAELFRTRGYAETSIRTIAESVDMRAASIYHHFESKDALLTEILAIGMEAVTAAFDDAETAAGPADTGAQRLQRHVAAHLDALWGHKAFTAAHVTVFPFVPTEVRTQSVADRDRYEARWTTLLTDIAPSLDPSQVRLVRLSLFGVMNSTLDWFDPAAEGSLDQLAGAFVTTLWDGLGTIGGTR
jgi:AcrR family transcriptional regulator